MTDLPSPSGDGQVRIPGGRSGNAPNPARIHELGLPLIARMLTSGSDRMAIRLSLEWQDEGGAWLRASWSRASGDRRRPCRQSPDGDPIKAQGRPPVTIGELIAGIVSGPNQATHSDALRSTSLIEGVRPGTTDPEIRRSAVVAGGTRGIRAAIVRRLVQDGFAVAINYAQCADDARRLADAMTQAGGRVIVVQADVSDPMAVTELFDAARSAFGGVDVLVNNAGILKTSPITAGDDALFESRMAVNLKGTFNTLCEAARALRDNGRIINVMSSGASLFQPCDAVDAAMTAGVEAITHILSIELRDRNITVNAVAPVHPTTALFPDGEPMGFADRLASIPPIGRLGTPADIAAAVAFLAAPDSGWINGHILRTNVIVP